MSLKLKAEVEKMERSSRGNLLDASRSTSDSFSFHDYIKTQFTTRIQSA